MSALEHARQRKRSRARELDECSGKSLTTAHITAHEHAGTKIRTRMQTHTLTYAQTHEQAHKHASTNIRTRMQIHTHTCANTRTHAHASTIMQTLHAHE